MKRYTFDSPIGRLTVETQGDYITHLWLSEQKGGGEPTGFHKECESQLKDYFSGSRKGFDLALKPQGTNFQQEVWEYLTTISYGTTQNYGEVAVGVSRPKAYRAVGGANGRNPIPIIIPCHRVINKNGELGGYSSGLDIKSQLLELEEKHKAK